MKKVAVVGAGRWGLNLIRVFDSGPLTTVSVVVEPSESMRLRCMELFPGIEVLPHLNQLENFEFDMVVVSSPAATHYQVVTWALERGLDVFVEKPLATNSELAESLTTQASRENAILMVGHTFLYNDALQWVKKEVMGGALGQIKSMRFTRTAPGPIRTDVGAIFDLASHDVAIALWLLKDKPLRVSARVESLLGRDVEDQADITLAFENNATAHINVSWYSPRKVRKITILGNKKTIMFNDLDTDSPLRIFDHTLTPELNERNERNEHEVMDKALPLFQEALPPLPDSKFFNEPLINEYSHFLECVSKRSNPNSDGAFATKVIKVLECCLKSASKNNQWIELNL